MTPTLFAELCLTPSTTLRQALERMDAQARGVLMLLRADGTLRRTLTDGDLRRAVLAQWPEHTAVSHWPDKTPISASPHQSAANILALMDAHQIDHVPVLDAQGRVLDVVFRRELSQRTWLSSPHLGDEELGFVNEAFSSNWIAPLGPNVDAFERELAATVGVAHAAALSSGTAALHLGLLLLGVTPGDTVFCSSLTFVASCNPILYCGAQPVFIDSEPESWNMSPAALERALAWAKKEGRLPRCVIIVNLYGQSANMAALLPICKKYGVRVLEDAAESLGGYYQQRASGTFGDLAVYSFNGNKIITTSGGGMLVSQDGELIAQARKLATQAREPAAHYEHALVGYNYRMSNVLAGIGRGQLKVLAERVHQRRQVFARYSAALADLPQICWMPEPGGHIATRWLSCFSLSGPDASTKIQSALQYLERHAIEARPVWKPMHLQPLYRDAPYFSHSPDTDVSAGLFASGMCLPSGSNLSEAQIDNVITHLRRALETQATRDFAHALA